MSDFSNEKVIETDNILQVKRFLASFVTALKNYALYPENHSISQKSLIITKDNLEEYLSNHKCLRLYVEDDKLLLQGSIAHQEKPEERVLVYPLFRDGIQWIEFHDGLTAEELKILLFLHI